MNPIGNILVGSAELARDGTNWYMDTLALERGSDLCVFLVLGVARVPELLYSDYHTAYMTDKGLLCIDDVSAIMFTFENIV